MFWGFPNDPSQQHGDGSTFQAVSNKNGHAYSITGKYPAWWQFTPTSGRCAYSNVADTYINAFHATAPGTCFYTPSILRFNYDSSTDGYIDDGGTEQLAAEDTEDGQYPIVPQSGQPGTLQPGSTLHGDNYVDSENGRFRLLMQLDGNLVLYESSTPIWSSGTVNNDPNSRAVMQLDGNFVIYDGNNQPIWATGTGDRSGAYLAVLDNGTLMLFDSAAHTVWFSNSGS